MSRYKGFKLFLVDYRNKIVSDNSRSNFLGYTFNRKNLAELKTEILENFHASNAVACVMACGNPHSLAVAQNDEDYSRALKSAEHLLCDGIGVYKVAKWLGIDVGPRVAGHSYYEMVMHSLPIFCEKSGRKGRVFFLGSTDHVLDHLRSSVTLKYPNLDIVGLISPPFGDWGIEVNANIIAAINDAKPDVLWVGMTAPKQEKWVFKNRHALQVPIIGSIGAVFDFEAGTYPRAPEWACRFGLEWLVRLAKEPKRMWRRTLVSGPIFFWMVIKYHVLHVFD
jgi:N-acetylglucosaminyldiphosphoundecaprenol N-acetyl-beta-D-mannosaminyltransferase